MKEVKRVKRLMCKLIPVPLEIYRLFVSSIC